MPVLFWGILTFFCLILTAIFQAIAPSSFLTSLFDGITLCFFLAFGEALWCQFWPDSYRRSLVKKLTKVDRIIGRREAHLKLDGSLYRFDDRDGPHF